MTSSANQSRQEIELFLLNEIIREPSRLAILHNSGILENDFLVYRDVYSLVETHIVKYQKPPTNDEILSLQPEWRETTGSFDHWLDLFTNAVSITRAQELIYESVTKFQQEPMNVESIVSDLASGLQSVAPKRSEPLHATDAAITERLKRFQTRREILGQNSDTVFGIRSGISLIDEGHMGWLPGDMVGIFARSGVGKTWFLIWQGVKAWLQGKRVLLISTEMPESQISMRMDVLMAGHIGIPISEKLLKAGHPSQEAAYSELTTALAKTSRWYTEDGER